MSNIISRSELRHDPIQKRWVIIAADRSRRPDGFARPGRAEEDSAPCPFCPGNEEMTPPEVVALREGGGEPNGPGWSVRVVSNKYPALRIEGELTRRGVGMYDQVSGVGAHEVLIESPDHGRTVDELSLEQCSLIYSTLQERLIDLMRDERFKYVLLFKNHGASAGATLPHPHHQVIATPVTPKTVASELNSARLHYLGKERCLFCDIIAQETEGGERIVSMTDRFIAFAPYASRSPFELFVAPRFHQHSLTEASPDDIRGLAEIMKDLLGRIRAGLDGTPYNYVIHNAPNTETKPRRPSYWATIRHDYHWHIEIVPRTTQTAGFEWGTGFYINPTPPEEAAEYLRGIDPGGSDSDEEGA